MLAPAPLMGISPNGHFGMLLELVMACKTIQSALAFATHVQAQRRHTAHGRRVSDAATSAHLLQQQGQLGSRGAVLAPWGLGQVPHEVNLCRL